MKRIICFDTSIATSNMGDYIISESCDYQLDYILKDNFVFRFPTHTPVSHWYQDFRKFSGGRYRDSADYKFLYGTNLINANMFVPTPTWNINIFNKRMSKGIICVGVGMGSSVLKPNIYTKLLYLQTLNKNFYHSTRDEQTANFLRSMGLKAINTGCATTWSLTPEHCKKIPSQKARNVVFTLTDYKKDVENDRAFIEILKKNYEKLYFWVQGVDDLEYLKSINVDGDVRIVPPSLKAYEEVLFNDIDYVGTRLHAGIKALQKGKRCIIIEVDNRTSDMRESISLNTIKRREIKSSLEKQINSVFDTDLGIKIDAINKWKGQFL